MMNPYELQGIDVMRPCLAAYEGHQRFFHCRVVGLNFGAPFLINARDPNPRSESSVIRIRGMVTGRVMIILRSTSAGMT